MDNTDDNDFHEKLLWDILGYENGVKNEYEFRKNIEYPVNFAKDVISNAANSSDAVTFFGGDFYDDMFNRTCVYFLHKHSEESKNKINECIDSPVVYIGITKALMTRINQHKRGLGGMVKDFDSFSVCYTKNISDAMKIEGIMTHYFKPKYNIQNQNYVTIKIGEYMGLDAQHTRSLYKVAGMDVL